MELAAAVPVCAGLASNRERSEETGYPKVSTKFETLDLVKHTVAEDA